MTKKRYCGAILMLAMLQILVGCEVEFSPNAKWKETPVVYCMLDQDLDTTWVRVQKCFLGEGSIYQFGSISDSINYPQGSISVSLLAYRNGTLQETIPLLYTERDHRQGDFASISQPLYYTDAPLNERNLYKIEVHRTSDGTLIASTDSIPLIIKDTSLALFTKPNAYDRFKFVASSGGTSAFTLEWNQLANARRYQPIIRFYYIEYGDTLHLDLTCSVVTSGNSQARLNTTYSRDAFLSNIKEALKDDPAPKRLVNAVDLYLTACDEDLNVYMNEIDNTSVLDQSITSYTNIRGGVGIYGARRTQLYRHVASDSSMVPPDGLQYLIGQLGVGFE